MNSFAESVVFVLFLLFSLTLLGSNPIISHRIYHRKARW